MRKNIEDMTPEEARAELQQMQEEFEQEAHNEDLQALEEGFEWKTTFCIHPKKGGDDWTKVAYTRNYPTPAMINKHLKTSETKDTYTVERLREVVDNNLPGKNKVN